MAITKIHAIRSTVQKSVDYICNPHKTDNRILIDNFACSLETAGFDFLDDNSRAGSKENAKPAYHLIQSFAPGEVTFEEAHKIGEELAREVLGNSRAYVLATHIDREHVHNHIIFCSTDFETHKRYYDNKSSYRNIRNVSDRLCKEHGLSVIIPGEEKGKKYNEWLADKKNNSHKLILKRDIFDCIRQAKDYEDFLRRMMEKGYQTKGSELGEDAPKYISFKPKDYGNFIRGSHKNLGRGHTKEEIIERIEKQIASRKEWIAKQNSLPLYEQNIRTFSGDHNAKSEYFTTLKNLQIAASTYANIGSLAELKEHISLLKDEIKQNRSGMVAIDKEKKDLFEQLRYLKIYKENKPFQDAYLSSKDPEHYLMEHESHLLLFEGACNKLKQFELNPDIASLEELQKHLEELEAERTKLKSGSDSLKKELEEANHLRENMEKYLGTNDKEHSEELKKERTKKERGI